MKHLDAAEQAIVGGSSLRARVELAKSGDHDAFAALANASADRLYVVAYRILRDPELARDAVQQTLLFAWRDLRGLRDPDRFEAWLYRILLRACYVEARQRQRWTVGGSPLGIARISSIDETAIVGDRDQLERGFRRLSPEQRAVVVIRYYLDLPLTEAATIMGVPVGTARSRLHYAMEQLRSALELDTRLARGGDRTA